MERFTKKEMGDNSWVARGDGFSGHINVKLGHDTPVWVVPSFLAYVSKAGFGGGGKGHWWYIKEEDQTFSMATIYACVLMLGVDSSLFGEPYDDIDRCLFTGSHSKKQGITLPYSPYILPGQLIAEELLAAANSHPNREFSTRDSYDVWEDLSMEAQDYLACGIRIWGSQSLIEAASLMGMVEPWCWRKGEDRKKRKYRKLDLHENDTLEAIQMATAKIGDVPTQDAVWNIWIKRKTEPREMQRTKFDKDLARLGFDWLPPKKPQRGESVLGRSTTGRGTKELGDFEI